MAHPLPIGAAPLRPVAQPSPSRAGEPLWHELPEARDIIARLVANPPREGASTVRYVLTSDTTYTYRGQDFRDLKRIYRREWEAMLARYDAGEVSYEATRSFTYDTPENVVREALDSSNLGARKAAA